MKKKNRIRIGVIADDFTGASDAASFLVKHGADTMLFTGIPDSMKETADCVVIALKSRSVSPREAIRQVKEATDFLKKTGTDCIYFKYCSTFDSTPQGNIGIVLDFLLDELQLPYTLLCPSLPVNGRTVKDGILYVYGTPLDESPMKNHPLNPMWDSHIAKLMRPQSRYPCIIIGRELFKMDQIKKVIDDYQRKYDKFYLIPDYETIQDGYKIAELFKTLPLLSGGSGLLEYLAPVKSAVDQTRKAERSKRCILLCGSCSAMSKKQIAAYRQSGGITYPVDSKKLLHHTLSAEEIFQYVQQASSPVLVYSAAVEQDIRELACAATFRQESKLIEACMADLSVMARDSGFDCIITAGGETSGAVTLRLGYHSYHIQDVIAPGVPELIPAEHPDMKLILKSGNFGDESFFMKALGKEKLYGTAAE